MLKPEQIQKIESLLKIQGLSEAITSTEESSLDIPEVETFSEDELKRLKSNSYQEGKKAGVEMDVDAIKKELNIESNSKTVKGLVEAIQKKTLEDAKIEPEKKVAELTERISTLTNTVKEYETKLSEKDNEVNSVKINGELYKHIPSLGENGPALGQDDVIQLMRANGYEFKLEEGKTVAYKQGKRLEDKMATPLAAGDVVKGFMSEKKLIGTTPTGRGGGDKKATGRPMNLSELKESFKAQGKHTQGQEFMDMAQKEKKENPDFDLNS